MEVTGPKSGLWIHTLLLDRLMIQRQRYRKDRMLKGHGEEKKGGQSLGTFEKSKFIVKSMIFCSFRVPRERKLTPISQIIP